MCCDLYWVLILSDNCCLPLPSAGITHKCVVADYAIGFGGKFGVQVDRQDKSAVGWDHHEGLHQHQSQTDHSKVKYLMSFRIMCQNFSLLFDLSSIMLYIFYLIIVSFQFTTQLMEEDL